MKDYTGKLAQASFELGIYVNRLTKAMQEILAECVTDQSWDKDPHAVVLRIVKIRDLAEGALRDDRDPDKVLSEENDTYLRVKERYLGHGCEGRWLVIKGERVRGIYDDYEDALDFGYKSIGIDEPFMVRQLTREDIVRHAITHC
jgi:hypothetical protein